MTDGERRQPVTGDRYYWHGVQITIGEVAPDGRWAMIHCVVPAHDVGRDRAAERSWDKQQPGTLDGLPADWEKIDGDWPDRETAE